MITGYRIDWTSNTTAGAVSGMVQTSNTLTSYTLTGLTNGAIYTVTVSAVNSVGTGTATSAVSGIPFTLPGRPSNLSSRLVDGQLVVLTWSPPVP